MTPGGGLYEANVKLYSVYSGSLTWTTRPVAQVRPLVRGACGFARPWLVTGVRRGVLTEWNR